VKSVVVIGAGVTGLTAAHRVLKSTREAGAAVSCTVLETSGRVGGKLRTEVRGGFTMELGADAILTRKPWAWELVQELGLGTSVLPIRRYSNSTYVLHSGVPVPLPTGMQLLVPSRWGPFLRSPLFSWGCKARVMVEPWVRRRAEEGDESVASFVRRRLGREMLETVAEPMLGGVYNGEAERQSIRATFPQFPELERKYGSLVRGVRAAGAEKAQREGTASDELPPFFSLAGGTEELARALEDAVRSLGGEIRSGAAATGIARRGERYVVASADGIVVDADVVIACTPAAVAKLLLREVAPPAAAGLGELRSSGIGTVYYGFAREQVKHRLDGYGVVVPRGQGRPYDGMMWSSSKWPGRAPEGRVLIRMFFGGPSTRDMLLRSDEEVTALLLREVREALGVTGEPVLKHLARWEEGYPQYDVGHLERIQRIRDSLPAGVMPAGCAYGGIGVPDCVRQGNEAANAALRQFGLVSHGGPARAAVASY
jgi:oxygen-dependent protoporphyrinogen oxidase